MRHALVLLMVGLACTVAVNEGHGAPRRRGGVRVTRTERAARKLALAALARDPDAARTSAADRFVLRDAITDADGSVHLRFGRELRLPTLARAHDRRGALRTLFRLHRNADARLDVHGGDVVVHLAPDGTLTGVSGTLRHGWWLDLLAERPATGRDEAVAIAREAFAARIGGAAALDDVRLAVHARDARAHLAVEVVLTGERPDQTPSELRVFVDVVDGAVLDAADAIHTGTGDSLFSGEVALGTKSGTTSFSLVDPTRGGQYTVDMNDGLVGKGTLFTDADDAWGDGTVTSRQTVAVDAHYGMAATWDYYLDVHGRSGIADDGVGAYNRVHYRKAYDNAFWSDSCFCMSYGDGDGTAYRPFVALDVIGHEMSHGVTAQTADLTYSDESGGLNEATSDIFGTAVEFAADNANDPPDYTIGEKLPTDGSALRYMYRPSKDGASADCWSDGVGDLDVHYSSGVANHFFYLLAEGSGVGPYTDDVGATTCDGSTVIGIGHRAAELVWYRALTVYMTSATDYAGARVATLAAAADLYGADGAEQAAVASAWSAVNVD